VRVSSKGQIVLPKSLRDKIGIADGDFIYVEEVDGIILLEKAAPSKLLSLTQQLRKEASNQNFTRDDLDAAISELRSENGE
jgi:antitoxin PrlF